MQLIIRVGYYLVTHLFYIYKNAENLVKQSLRRFDQQGMRESNPVGNPHNPCKISISSIEF